MPLRLDPAGNSKIPFQTMGEKIKYDYPDNLKLSPDSDLHKELVSLILDRAIESNNIMKKRFSSWREIDRTLTAYIPAEEVEKKEQHNKTTPVVVPVAYATKETLMTYLVNAFLNDPIFSYQGFGPEDAVKAHILEQVIMLQSLRFKLGLSLYTMFSDALSYGIGVMNPHWDSIQGFRTVLTEDPVIIKTMKKIFGKDFVKRTRERKTLFEGTNTTNINTYLYLPDPNVSAHEVQKGEFVGWIDQTNYMNLLELEQDDPETYFNIRYLDGYDGRSTLAMSDESGRQEKAKRDGQDIANTTNPVDVIYMYINLIPKKHGLGDKEYPEKWLFGLAADGLIIRAHPLDVNHGMYPVVTGAPEFDGYSSSPIGKMEVVYGLQDTIDSLFQSHVANVKKAVNDMLVVDPSLVNMYDLKNPGPGRLVRLRRHAWGRGVNNAVKQLDISDITRGNVADVSQIMGLIQKISGATDPIFGVVREGSERRTAAEFQGSRSSALSRVQKAAKVMSMQAMNDLAYIYASNAQQFMSEEAYIQVTGGLRDSLIKEYGYEVDALKVSPEDIIFHYDIIQRDGIAPGGESPQLWVNLYQILAQNPEVAGQFDMVRVFEHVARQLGARNVQDFKKRASEIQPQVVSNEEALKGVDKGNLVPVGDQNEQ